MFASFRGKHELHREVVKDKTLSPNTFSFFLFMTCVRFRRTMSHELSSWPASNAHVSSRLALSENSLF